MTAKEYLRQIQTLDLKINHKMEELQELRAKAVSTTQALSQDRVQSSSSGDKMAGIVEAYVAVEEEIKKMLVAYIRQKGIIIDQIHKVDDPLCIDLLYLRYVRYKSLNEIADILKKPSGEPYSYDHIVSMHGKALQKFQKILSESHKIPYNPM